MAILTTNTVPLTTLKAVTAGLSRLVASLRSTPKTPADHCAAEQRCAAARTRIDTLLR